MRELRPQEGLWGRGGVPENRHRISGGLAQEASFPNIEGRRNCQCKGLSESVGASKAEQGCQGWPHRLMGTVVRHGMREATGPDSVSMVKFRI